MVAVGADLLALTLITPPGEQGADVYFGTTRRFRCAYGGFGAARRYLSVHRMPGRCPDAW